MLYCKKYSYLTVFYNNYNFRGTRERELGNRSRALLEQGSIYTTQNLSNKFVTAEAKQREAMRREREADDNEKMVRYKCLVFFDKTVLSRLLMVRETFTDCVISCW